MTYSTPPKGDIEEIARLARAGMKPVAGLREFRDGGSLLVHDASGGLRGVGLAPAASLFRKRRDVYVSTTNALVNYVREWSANAGGYPGVEPHRHAEAFYTPDLGGVIRVILDARERPALFADNATHEEMAAKDPSNPPAMGFDQHQVECALAADTRWAAWESMHKKWLTQTQLADFLDERFRDTVPNPDPSDKSVTVYGVELRDVARNFKSTRTQSLRSAIERTTGDVVLSYTNVETKGDTTFTFPDQVFIQLPVYVDGEKVVARVKTSFRVSEASVSFHLEIVDLPLIKRQAIEHEVKFLVEKAEWLEGRTYLCGERAWCSMQDLFARTDELETDE